MTETFEAAHVVFFVAFCLCFPRKKKAKKKVSTISPPMSPEEQLYMIQMHEETLKIMQTKPSHKDQEVSQQLAVNPWQPMVQSPFDLWLQSHRDTCITSPVVSMCPKCPRCHMNKWTKSGAFCRLAVMVLNIFRLWGKIWRRKSKSIITSVLRRA